MGYVHFPALVCFSPYCFDLQKDHQNCRGLKDHRNYLGLKGSSEQQKAYRIIQTAGYLKDQFNCMGLKGSS